MPKRSYAKKTVLLATLAWATPAAAADDSVLKSATHWFDSMDVNHDGAMTLAEMTKVADKQFHRIDGDHDGRVSKAEFLFGIPPDRQAIIDRYGKRFALMDADQDGFATQAEYDQFNRLVLQAADADQDGKVTKQEFLAVAVGE